MEHLNGTPINRGGKWAATGDPQPFRRRGRRESHDYFFCLGRKRYGITKADENRGMSLQFQLRKPSNGSIMYETRLAA